MSAVPTLAPSTLSCTRAIPTLSEAVAVIGIVPDSVAPDVGEVIATVGVIAVLLRFTVTPALVVTLPAV